MANQCMNDEESLLLVEPLQELYKTHPEENLYRWKPHEDKKWFGDELQWVLDKEPKETIEKLLEKWHELYYYTAQEVVLHWVFHELCPRNDSYLNVLLKVSVLNDFYSTGIWNTAAVAKRIWDLSYDEGKDAKGKPIRRKKTNDVDSRLQAVDLTLIEDIAKDIVFLPKDVFGNDDGDTDTASLNDGKVKTRSFWSFASKYCYHHKINSNEGKEGEELKEFPILDSNVVEMLYYFQKKDHFIKNVKKDLGPDFASKPVLTRDKTINTKTLRENPVVLHAVLCHFRRYYDLRNYSLRQIDHYLWLRGKIDTYMKNKNKKKK